MTDTKKIASSYENVSQLVSKYKKQNKKIVLTQGSFDMVHIGHGRYLEKAKEQGDILFVGLDDDQKIRYRKGPDRPIVPQEERLEMLSYFSSVDHVVLKDLNKPKWELIKIIQPDVLIATAETYSPQQIKDLEKICGQVVVLDYQATTSTSAKIRRIQLNLVQKIETLLEEIKNA